jgi:hypothetical protein
MFDPLSMLRDSLLESLNPLNWHKHLLPHLLVEHLWHKHLLPHLLVKGTFERQASEDILKSWETEQARWKEGCQWTDLRPGYPYRHYCVCNGRTSGVFGDIPFD